MKAFPNELQKGDVLPKEQAHHDTEEKRQDDLRGYTEWASGRHSRGSL